MLSKQFWYVPVVVLLYIFLCTFQPKSECVVLSSPELAVLTGASIIASVFYTDVFKETKFQTLKREQLSLLPYSIVVGTCKTRYLQINGENSNEWLHVSRESVVMLTANVCILGVVLLSLTLFNRALCHVSRYGRRLIR